MIPFFSPNRSSLSPFCCLFSPNPYQTLRAGRSLLVKSELVAVDIHSPPSVKGITLLFAWLALCGGAIPPWRWIPHTGIRLGGEKLNESVSQSEMEF